MNSIDNILFPTDLSPPAEAALGHAAFLAESLGSRLVLYHVTGIPVSEYAAWGAGKEGEVWQRVDAAARQTLQRRAEKVRAPWEIIVRHEVGSVTEPRGVSQGVGTSGLRIGQPPTTPQEVTGSIPMSSTNSGYDLA